MTETKCFGMDVASHVALDKPDRQVTVHICILEITHSSIFIISWIKILDIGWKCWPFGRSSQQKRDCLQCHWNALIIITNKLYRKYITLELFLDLFCIYLLINLHKIAKNSTRGIFQVVHLFRLARNLC